MVNKITREQYENMEYARSCDRHEYHELLEEYTGIVSIPYTTFAYYDSAGNYLGDSSTHDLDDLLEAGYIEVGDNG